MTQNPRLSRILDLLVHKDCDSLLLDNVSVAVRSAPPHDRGSQTNPGVTALYQDRNGLSSLPPFSQILRNAWTLVQGIPGTIKTTLSKAFTTQHQGQASLPMTNSPATAAQSSVAIRRQTDPLSILLCIDKGELNTELHQVSLGGVDSDGSLFQLLRKEYFSRRKLRSRVTLRSVKSLHLSKVSLLYLKCQLMVKTHQAL